MTVASEILWPTHFSLVYGGGELDSDHQDPGREVEGNGKSGYMKEGPVAEGSMVEMKGGPAAEGGPVAEGGPMTEGVPVAEASIQDPGLNLSWAQGAKERLDGGGGGSGGESGGGAVGAGEYASGGRGAGGEQGGSAMHEEDLEQDFDLRAPLNV